MSRDGQVILVGLRSSATARLYLSKDGGTTWLNPGVAAGVPGGFLPAFVSGNGQVMLAGGQGIGGKLFISRNGGTTWSVALPGSSDQGWYSISGNYDGQVLIASAGGIGGGLHLSKDAGVTWTKVSLARPGLTDGSHEGVAVSGDGLRILAVQTTAPPAQARVAISLDGGNRWSPYEFDVAGAAGLVGAALAADGRLAITTGRGLDAVAYRFTMPADGMGMPPVSITPAILKGGGPDTTVEGRNDEVLLTQGAIDGEFGGDCCIYGVVELYAQAGNIPLPRRVRLHRSRDGLLVRETWSDAQGNYRFDGITERYTYDVIAWDHEGLQQSVVANDLTPEVMP